MKSSRLFAACAGVVMLFAAGCGGGGPSPTAASQRPVAAATTTPAAVGAPAANAGAKVPGGTVQRAVAGLVPDPEAAQSSPQPAGAPAHAAAHSPAHARAAIAVARGAPSDAEVRAELAQMNKALKAQHAAQAAAVAPGAGAVPAGAQIPPGYTTQFGGGVIDAAGNAAPPAGAPGAIARIMGGGNAIATFPYVFGGGHASFLDSAYDCSGSVSYALAAAGLLSAPITSGELESWGVPGPGRWVTVLASAGHVYMYVAGLRFDTSFRNGPYGTRWQPWARNNVGFAARHWPGL